MISARKRALWLLAAVIALADAGYLDANQRAPISHLAEVIELESLGLVRPADQAMPRLESGGWEVDGKPLPDLWAYARAQSRELGYVTGDGPLVLISFGPEPSYGRLLDSIRALRADGFCHVAIPSAEPASNTEITMSVVRLCGSWIGRIVGANGLLSGRAPA